MYTHKLSLINFLAGLKVEFPHISSCEKLIHVGSTYAYETTFS